PKKRPAVVSARRDVALRMAEHQMSERHACRLEGVGAGLCIRWAGQRPGPTGTDGGGQLYGGMPGPRRAQRRLYASLEQRKRANRSSSHRRRPEQEADTNPYYNPALAEQESNAGASSPADET